MLRIPDRLLAILAQEPDLRIGTESSFQAMLRWLEISKLPFFPDYTDHGPKHIFDVLTTAEQLVSQSTWSKGLLTPQDVAVLVLSVVLHDSAMHLTEDGFISLLCSPSNSAKPFKDLPWPLLWQQFLKQTSNLPASRCLAVFGTEDCPKPPKLSDPAGWTEYQRRVIGEFIRINHHRLAQEIADGGFPGTVPGAIVLDEALGELRQLAGLVARSHAMDLRTSVDALNRIYHDRICPLNCHAPFIMVLLRIADFVQIQADRAPITRLRIQSLRSPISRTEWSKHSAVKYVNMYHPDPESLYVNALPQSADIFLSLTKLLSELQHELDHSWAILGEIYGRFVEEGLDSLGIRVRRVRTNLNQDEYLETLPFVPSPASFGLASADLLKLMVRPLYGDKPEIAIRELVQNACDAVLEAQFLKMPAIRQENALEGDVVVRLERDVDGQEVLSVADAGIGMTAETVQEYFLKAGASSRTSSMWKSRFEDDEGRPKIIRSGRFGVGALACFLLGDRFEVTTRHILREAETGLRFYAHLDGENLELRRMTLPAGTKISVPLPPTVAKKLRKKPDTWDWWRLDFPQVQRFVDDKRLPQRHYVPSAGAPLPPGWRRIDSDDYDDIAWSFRDDAPEVVLNGIEMRDARQIGSYQPDAEAFSVELRFPRISIFDSRGHLPLKLDRSGLASRVPFEDQLMTDVARDAVAHAVINAPDQVPPTASSLQGYFRSHEAVVSYERAGYGQRSIWYCTSSGAGICESWSLAEAKIRRLFIVSVRHQRSVPTFLKDLAAFPNSALVFIASEGHPYWLTSYIMGDSLISGRTTPSGVGHNVRVVKRIAYQHRSLGALTAKSPEFELKRMGDWMALSTGPREEAAEEIYHVVNAIAGGQGFLGEWLLEPEPERRTSWLSKTWLEYLREPLIPFDKAARKNLLEEANDLMPYFRQGWASEYGPREERGAESGTAD